MKTEEIKVSDATIIRKEIHGQKLYVHVYEGEEFVRMEDVERLLQQVVAGQQLNQQENEEDETLPIMGTYEIKDVILNGEKVEAYDFNGILYINMAAAAAITGASTSGMNARVRWIEENLRQEFETKRQKEIQESGHSDIDPEQDSKIRHRFNARPRMRFIRLEDIKKYFFGTEPVFPGSTQKGYPKKK
jgi:hypothetical protein